MSGCGGSRLGKWIVDRRLKAAASIPPRSPAPQAGDLKVAPTFSGIRSGDVLTILGDFLRDALLVPAGVAGQEAGGRGGAVQAQAVAEADAHPPDEDIRQGEGQLVLDGVDGLGADVRVVGADALAQGRFVFGQGKDFKEAGAVKGGQMLDQSRARQLLGRRNRAKARS